MTGAYSPALHETCRKSWTWTANYASFEEKAEKVIDFPLAIVE